MGSAITAPSNQSNLHYVSAYISKQLRNLEGMWNVYHLILQIRATYCVGLTAVQNMDNKLIPLISHNLVTSLRIQSTTLL